jgi:hypothetical protein
MNDGYSTKDIWEASCLAMYHPVSGINLLDNYNAEWFFDCASEDAKILRDEYNNHQLSVDLLAFVHSYNTLVQEQNRVRRSGLPGWRSPAWIRGECK